MDYNVIENMKKTKDFYFLFFDIYNSPKPRYLILQTFMTYLDVSKKSMENIESRHNLAIVKPNFKTKQKDSMNDAITGNQCKSQTPPFILTLDIFNHNVHNYLVDVG
jgi:hypothetical protein